MYYGIRCLPSSQPNILFFCPRCWFWFAPSTQTHTHTHLLLSLSRACEIYIHSMPDAEQYRFFYTRYTRVLTAMYVLSVEVATFHIIIANQAILQIEIDTHYTDTFFYIKYFHLTNRFSFFSVSFFYVAYR